MYQEENTFPLQLGDSHYHDDFFKQNMQFKSISKAFFTHVMPGKWKEWIDFDGMVPFSETKKFHHKNRFLDSLFITTTTDGNRVYINSEHYMKFDLMKVQQKLLEYHAGIFEHHVKQLDEDDSLLSKGTLPQVLQVVLYNGQGANPLKGIEKYYAPPFVYDDVGNIRFLFMDVHTVSDEEIAELGAASTFIFFLKRGSKGDFSQHIDSFKYYLRNLPAEGLLLGLEYALRSETREINEIIRIFKEIHPDKTEDITAMQGLLQRQFEYKGLQKGLLKGLRKGRKEGIEQGSEQARYTIARNMLSKGMNERAIKELTGIDPRELKK